MSIANTTTTPEAATQLLNWCDIEMLKPFFHEAGHAVIARVTGFKVAWVSVDAEFIQNDPIAIESWCSSGAPTCMTISSLRLNPIFKKRSALNKHDKETIIGYCMHVMAGPGVEKRMDPEGFDVERCRNDIEQVASVLNLAEPNSIARKKLWKTAMRRLDIMLHDHWEAIWRVGEALRQRSTLTGDEVDQIISQPDTMRKAA